MYYGYEESIYDISLVLGFSEESAAVNLFLFHQNRLKTCFEGIFGHEKSIPDVSLVMEFTEEGATIQLFLSGLKNSSWLFVV